jgi:hypothetical protein
MKFTRFTAPLLAALMLVGPMVTSSIAQETTSRWQWTSPSAITTDSWKFSANVYGWIPWAPVDIEAGGQSVHFSESFSTLLDSLIFAATGEAEVHKGPFGVFVSPAYYKGETDEKIRGPLGGSHKATLKESVWLINYGASYDLGTLRLGDAPGSPTVTLRPYAGASYLHDNIKFDIMPGLLGPDLRERTTIEFNTPIIGLNTLWDLSDRWSLRIGGYYGGWGVDDVDGTYQIVGDVAYHFQAWDQPAKLFVGYRHLHLNYDDGPAVLKLTVTGPFLGFGVGF